MSCMGVKHLLHPDRVQWSGFVWKEWRETWELAGGPAIMYRAVSGQAGRSQTRPMAAGRPWCAPQYSGRPTCLKGL